MCVNRISYSATKKQQFHHSCHTTYLFYLFCCALGFCLFFFSLYQRSWMRCIPCLEKKNALNRVKTLRSEAKLMSRGKDGRCVVVKKHWQSQLYHPKSNWTYSSSSPLVSLCSHAWPSALPVQYVNEDAAKLSLPYIFQTVSCHSSYNIDGEGGGKRAWSECPSFKGVTPPRGVSTTWGAFYEASATQPGLLNGSWLNKCWKPQSRDCRESRTWLSI